MIHRALTLQLLKKYPDAEPCMIRSIADNSGCSRLFD